MHAISTGEQEEYPRLHALADRRAQVCGPRGGQPPRLYLRPLRQGVPLHPAGLRAGVLPGLGRGSVRALPLGRGPAEVPSQPRLCGAGGGAWKVVAAPWVVRDGKIQYGGDFDYEVQRRHMERTR